MKKCLTLALLAALLLCGCGKAETFSFPVIENDTVTQTEVPAGTVLPGCSLVYTAAGDVFYAEDYTVTEALTGVISDPPARCVTDAAVLAREAMDAGERVLLIYIDGLGYERFCDAATAGEVPNLAALTLEKCASVYPTITPVNYAAMVSGLPPAENGVDRRGVHALICETIFSDAAAHALTAFAAEGDSQILALPGAELELCPDLNGDGTGDDEIFETAMAHLDADLLFVHFHSVDDASHENGPWSDAAKAALTRADAWCGALLEAWDGAVIVAADHGQHEQDGSGDAAYADRRGTHGDFAPSDIFTPFLTR